MLSFRAGLSSRSACSLNRRSTRTRPRHGLFDFRDYKQSNIIVNGDQEASVIRKLIFLFGMGLILLTGCNLPRANPAISLPTPTALVLPTATLAPTMTPTKALTATPTSFASCADNQTTTLINNFKTALQTSNGELLSSLVSPVHGMDVRYYRDGRVVNYNQVHARYVFGTIFRVNWGRAPGSGKSTVGSFHEVILPALLDVFNRNYTVACNQILVGGTYQAVWPYSGINFYSVYYPGTQLNGNLDWHTWVIGVDYVGGNPYLYALMQFQWEP